MRNEMALFSHVNLVWFSGRFFFFFPVRLLIGRLDGGDHDSRSVVFDAL
jgi:hypothetical protein